MNKWSRQELGSLLHVCQKKKLKIFGHIYFQNSFYPPVNEDIKFEINKRLKFIFDYKYLDSWKKTITFYCTTDSVTIKPCGLNSNDNNIRRGVNVTYKLYKEPRSLYITQAIDAKYNLKQRPFNSISEQSLFLEYSSYNNILSSKYKLPCTLSHYAVLIDIEMISLIKGVVRPSCIKIEN